MITAEEAHKKAKQNLVDLSVIESKINNAIEDRKFEIELTFQGDNLDKIYEILSDYFTSLGYKVLKSYSSYECIGIKINWDLE